MGELLKVTYPGSGKPKGRVSFHAQAPMAQGPFVVPHLALSPATRNRSLLTLMCDQACGQSTLLCLGLVPNNILASPVPDPGRKFSTV